MSSYSPLEAIGLLAVVFGTLWAATKVKAIETALSALVVLVVAGVTAILCYLSFDAARSGKWLGAMFAALAALPLLAVFVLMPLGAWRDWKWRRSVRGRNTSQ